MSTNSALNYVLTAQITLLDGLITGLREIHSLGSILQVRAAPFAELDRMKSAIGGFITYIIDVQRIYTGHGRGTRNIGDRISQEAWQSGSQVYLIYSLDKRFDKPAASYVEARLIDIAAELAIPLANSVRPFGRDGLTLSPDVEQLVQQAQVLLSVAGFRRFEEARQTQSGRPVRVAATGDLHDLRVLEPEAMTVPTDTPRMRLICPDLHAEGYQVGDRFHVLPDADYCYEFQNRIVDRQPVAPQGYRSAGYSAAAAWPHRPCPAARRPRLQKRGHRRENSFWQAHRQQLLGGRSIVGRWNFIMGKLRMLRKPPGVYRLANIVGQMTGGREPYRPAVDRLARPPRFFRDVSLSLLRCSAREQLHRRSYLIPVAISRSSPADQLRSWIS